MIHFLINPISGGGEGKKVHDFLPEIMESMGFGPNDFKAEFTTREGANAQIHNALRGSDKVIAVGGDGTVSSVLTALIDSPRASEVEVGLIPLGTGNDLARVLHLYDAYANRGLLYLVRHLVEATPRPFDLWKVNDKWVLANYFSSGIDARIAHDFNRDRAEGRIPQGSVLLNKLHYIRRFWKDRNHRLGKATMRVLDHEGQWHEYDLSGQRTVIIGNIPSFAGGSNPFQESDMADGTLEAVMVPHLWNFLGAILFGTDRHTANWFNRWFLPSIKCREVELMLDSREYIQLDGEDLSGQVHGLVRLRYACQVQLLALEPSAT